MIVCSGFGGLFAAKSLARAPDTIEVSLISRTNRHLFHPLLYQVATGILSEGHRDCLPRSQRRLRIVDGRVSAVDGPDGRGLTAVVYGENGRRMRG